MNNESNVTELLDKLSSALDKIPASENEFTSVETNISEDDRLLLDQLSTNPLSVVDPSTGLRYAIPGLLTESPTYMQDYAALVSLKYLNPSEFNRIISGEV